jgi:peptide deformylase
MNIIKFPNAVLRERIPEFDFSNPTDDPKQLEKEMIEMMFANDGIGLAANQVGKNIRMFVMGHKDLPENAQAFFNPVVVANTDEIDNMEEGCLSFPGVYVNIKRPTEIQVEYQNADGETERAEFKGYDCKCFLHEYDHLEGITYQDRVSTLKWALAVKKSKKRK